MEGRYICNCLYYHICTTVRTPDDCRTCAPRRLESLSHIHIWTWTVLPNYICKVLNKNSFYYFCQLFVVFFKFFKLSKKSTALFNSEYLFGFTFFSDMVYRWRILIAANLYIDNIPVSGVRVQLDCDVSFVGLWGFIPVFDSQTLSGRLSPSSLASVHIRCHIHLSKRLRIFA